MNSIHCFCIKRGDSRQSRIDVDYFHPEFVELKKKIHRLSKTVLISNILSKNLQTGFPAGKNDQEERDGFGIVQIRPTQIKLDGEIDLTDPIRVKEDICSLSDILNKDEVLFNNTNSSIWVGKSTVFDSSFKCVCSNHITRLTLKEEFEPHFIMEIFNWLHRSKYFYRLCTNFNNQAGINNDSLISVEIPMPDKIKRQMILAYLQSARDNYCSKISQAEELLKVLDEYILGKLNFLLPQKSNISRYAITKSMLNNRIDPYSNQSHFRKLFNELSKIKYNTQTIKSISNRIISGSTPLSGGKAYTQPPNGIRFIRSGEITSDGSVTAESVNHIKEGIHLKSLQRSQLKKNDVLIAIVGATIGQVGVYEFEDEANINQAIAAVSISDPKVLPQYLCWYLKSSLGQMILDYFKRPVARANINLEEIAQIPVIIPKKEIQLEIINEVFRRKSESNKLKTEAETEWQNAKKWFEEQLLEGAK